MNTKGDCFQEQVNTFNMSTKTCDWKKWSSTKSCEKSKHKMSTKTCEWKIDCQKGPVKKGNTSKMLTKTCDCKNWFPKEPGIIKIFWSQWYIDQDLLI